MSMPPILPNPTVRVETKSAWMSKINWTQIGSSMAALLTANVFGLDFETQAKVLLGLNIAQSVGTVVLKTWFTNTVSPQSMPPAPASIG